MRARLLTLSVLGLVALVGCGDDPGPSNQQNPQEFITDVILTFAPTTGVAIIASSSDDDGNGTIDMQDTITLTAGTNYSLSIGLLNSLETPVEDIGLEIADEDDEHQFFFTGTGVQSEATGAVANAILTVTYGDMDDNNDPVGLVDNAVTANVAGSGEFRVVLRHLPELKVSGLAGTVANDPGGVNAGIANLPGDSDIDVTFMLTVGN
ncbi:MAG: hypothetical protein AAF658_05145 [Myxococcota bacterium]